MLTRTCSICVPSSSPLFIFFCPDTAPTELYTLSLHDALPISRREGARGLEPAPEGRRRDHVDRRTEARQPVARDADPARSEEHTSELQSHHDLVCRLLLEKKKINSTRTSRPKGHRRTPADHNN